MIESSKKVAPWRDAVRSETQRVMTVLEIPPFAEPVTVMMRFFLTRPASAPKRVTRPAKYPDLDKLVRSTMDGLAAGGALANDSIVVAIMTSKHFATPESPAGVVCTIAGLDEL